MTLLVRVVVLVVIWLALWGEVTPANLASGLLVSVGVVAGFDRQPRGRVVVRPVHAVRFALHFTWRLAVSGVVVARTVIAPAHRVRTGVVAVPLLARSDALVTLVVGAVNLTPGTLVIEVRSEPPTLFVHALDVKAVEEVQAEVQTLQVLAMRAFGPREALAALPGDHPHPGRAR